MSTSLEQVYAAVEQAYGAGDYQTALDTAEALLPQIPSDRDDQLQQRLQLLMGHLHLYGLRQPAQAAAAYRAVLNGCQEPSYRALAAEGLQQAEQPSTAQAAGDQAATPWLEELRPPAAEPPLPREPERHTAPDPYDRGLLQLKLAGRPSELDRL